MLSIKFYMPVSQWYNNLDLTGCICMQMHAVYSLRPRPNRRHFADDIFKCIFENENEWISPRISLKVVPMVRINNIPALVQIMAWRRPGDKPLSQPMMVSLLTHICVTRPQWVKSKLLCRGTKSWHQRQARSARTSLIINFLYDMKRDRRWPHRIKRR